MTRILETAPPAAATAALPIHFHSVTLIGAAVAAVATFGTIAAALPASAMFLGWVGYSVGAQTTREGVGNLASFLLGLALGLGTGLAIALLTPVFGPIVTPLAIFADVVIVLSLRTLPLVNNALAYFLGLISFFACGQPPSAPLFVTLATAGVIGAAAAWTAGFLQSRVQPG